MYCIVYIDQTKTPVYSIFEIYDFKKPAKNFGSKPVKIGFENPSHSPQYVCKPIIAHSHKCSLSLKWIHNATVMGIIFSRCFDTFNFALIIHQLLLRPTKGEKIEDANKESMCTYLRANVVCFESKYLTHIVWALFSLQISDVQFCAASIYLHIHICTPHMRPYIF